MELPIILILGSAGFIAFAIWRAMRKTRQGTENADAGADTENMNEAEQASQKNQATSQERSEVPAYIEHKGHRIDLAWFDSFDFDRDMLSIMYRDPPGQTATPALRVEVTPGNNALVYLDNVVVANIRDAADLKPEHILLRRAG